MFFHKLAMLALPLGAIAAPIRARQGNVGADSAKLADSISSALTNIGALLVAFDVQNDLTLFRAGNIAVDGITNAQPSVAKIVADVKAGKAPSLADQLLVKVGIDQAEKNLKIVEKNNDAKKTQGAADKEASLKKALSDSEASVATAKDAAAKLLSAQGKQDGDLINEGRLKVVDNLNTVKGSISSLLNVLDPSTDSTVFRSANQAIDEVVNGIDAATTLINAAKANGTPADADQVAMTLALEFATRFLTATKRRNAQKLASQSTFDNTKESAITKSLEAAKAALEDAVLLDTSILTTQGKTVDDVIGVARKDKIKGLTGA